MLKITGTIRCTQENKAMKLVKLTRAEVTPLWDFFERNLPSTLTVEKISDGYGGTMFIYVKPDLRGSRLPDRIKNWFGIGIATIGDGYVELRRPEYFSDFEGIIRKYETATHKDVTFKYWES
jgi:hypothetical protein